MQSNNNSDEKSSGDVISEMEESESQADRDFIASESSFTGSVSDSDVRLETNEGDGAGQESEG